jgi:hypothetical protein
MKQTLKMRVLSGITAVMTVGSIILPASFAKAASPTNMTDTLTRLKVSTSSTHSLVIGSLPSWASGTNVDIEFSAALDSSGIVTGSITTSTLASGTFSASIVSGTKLRLACISVAACSGALGAVTFAGTNETSADSKTVTIDGSGGVTGSFAIPLVTDDQVVVSATVDPSITFDVGVQPSATACNGTFDDATLSDWALSLGTIAPNTLVSSDANSIEHICTRISTNATGGAVVTVKSLNSSLKSTSVAADTIPSATETLTIAGGLSTSQGYGICAGHAAADWGFDTTVPAGVAPTSSSPYNTSCDSTSLKVGILDGTSRPIMTVTDPSGNAFERLYVKAMIDGTQPAHNDYTDTLTFIATGTF